MEEDATTVAPEKLGAFALSDIRSTRKRISMLLWGSAGCGKTTLAATAPGKKLWINFDPDGTNSIASRDDVLLLDLSNERAGAVIEALKSDNDALRLTQFLTDHPEVETVVFDSMTMLGQIATAYAVTQVKNATMERPSLQGYGYRNAYITQTVMKMLRLTGKLNRHIIFIAHEDAPVTNDEGVVLHITTALGGKLSQQVPLQLSEVWNMRDDGRKRYIAVRPVRSRQPMKSRMFKGSPEFVLTYDADKDSGNTIASFYEKWESNGFAKIDTP